MKQNTDRTQLAENIVSGSISVSDGSRSNTKSINSSSEWFTEDYYTVTDDGECLIIRKCYMEIPKKAYKFSKKKTFRNVYIDAPNGKYDFNEESTEDELVVYYL